MIIERFPLHAFTQYRAQPSEVKPGYTLQIPSKLFCPRCGLAHEMPGENTGIKCDRCDLAIWRKGEILECAAREPTPPDGWKPQT